jgi:hypothetical protein
LQDAGGQINFEQSNITEDEFRQVVDRNDPQQCETWLTRVTAQINGDVAETERARVRLEDEAVIEGRVIIDRQQPSIQIDEQAAEVTVGRTTPDVNLTQAEPRVQVSMPEPTVELDLYQATDPENSPGIEISQRQSGGGTDGAAAEPEVTMRRAEAQIVYQDGGQEQQQANVSFSRSEPNIRFEQAEPQIDVASTGEPRINWSQTGEARVTFRDSAGQDESGQDGSGQNANRNTEAASNAASSQQASPESGQQPTQQNASDPAQSRPPAVRRDGYTGVEVEQVAATDIQGAVLYGVQGNDIGEIGALITSREEAQTVVADIGGAMGVEIPFADLTILQAEDSSDIRVYINASAQRLQSYPQAE